MVDLYRLVEIEDRKVITREQEQDILGMRKEIENIMGKNAQLETKLEKTLTVQTDLATRTQGDKDQGPGEQRNDEDQAASMGPFSRVATVVTSTVSNDVFGTKKNKDVRPFPLTCSSPGRLFLHFLITFGRFPVNIFISRSSFP